MSTTWARTLCRLLIALMIWTPYQFATAGMIGTDQVVASTAQQDRDAVVGFLTRSDVQRQMQALGMDPSNARERVAAMTDQEVQSLAGRIQSLPAGGINDEWTLVIVLVLIGAAVWWFWRR
jgi:hypothetical protein